ncbi:hypothetical protein ER308_01235 [Egibacter rhizosphaerae]|uniref:Uncharacterized protein n=1 Tax=Egibacter rhizosphaerae TaxID=1670831 RepID=A0A411YAX2_9ACTN|nr:hypothetical protein [Egibacter rhizosphaerae]QBI18327.1 hypothetical protein ER308_01235 [Egibacter rhizosphaerae]
MSHAPATGRAARRAPRLAPDERLAGYITRRGRFARKDPSKGRKLPGRWKWLGALLWVAWLAYPFWQGWRERAADDG